MPGFRGGSSYAAVTAFTGFSGATGATTANQVLAEMIFPWDAGRIAGCDAAAQTAGTGAGNQVLDVLLNGTSIWTNAADRPTLLGTGTGRYTMAAANTRGLRYGDRITIVVAAIAASTGQARVACTVALEKA